MLKVRIIPNPAKFLQLIEQSCGNVFLHLPNGNICDLKKDQTAFQMLKIMKPSSDGLSLSFTDPDDSSAFISYLMGARL